jgi:hypothetical protein
MIPGIANFYQNFGGVEQKFPLIIRKFLGIW